LAETYVKTTITQLPNFYATRETIHFEDTPSQQTDYPASTNTVGSLMRAAHAAGIGSGSSEYKSLHSTNSFSATVTYRDGLEVRDAGAAKDKKEGQPAGLTTSGEFGPILSVVLGDATRGVVDWLRWEQGASEPVAVFRYVVAGDQSNYLVGIPSGGKTEELYPGYHGEIAVDPATGAILRISVVAELPPPHEMMQTAILVEYAPVEIGAESYICPVHGVAFSKGPVAHGAPQGAAVAIQTQLNDVTFAQYHLFRSEARIVQDGDGKGDAAVPERAPQVSAPPANSDAPSADHAH
jgi:hypothetical protein